MDSTTRFSTYNIFIIRICLGHWPTGNGYKYFRFWLSFCGVIKTDSPGYDTLGRLKNSNNSAYSNQSIWTHWSVSQVSSNYEKKWRSKISLDCSFKEGETSFFNSCSIDNVSRKLTTLYIKTIDWFLGMCAHRYVAKITQWKADWCI